MCTVPSPAQQPGLSWLGSLGVDQPWEHLQRHLAADGFVRMYIHVLICTNSFHTMQADGLDEPEEVAFRPPPPAKPRRPLGSVGDDDFGYQVDEEGVR